MKPIKLFQKLKTKKIIYLSLILFLLVGSGAIYGYNFFQNSRKAKAAYVYCDTGHVNCLILNTGFGSKSLDIFEADTTYDNSNLRIDGSGDSNFEVNFWGHHNLNSLTVANSAKVTHRAIVFDDLVNPMLPRNGELTANGKSKRVDLTIVNDLILTSGGKIDVNGKGYPGANYERYETTKPDANSQGDTNLLWGYGPGGAESMDGHYNNHWGGAGGSYGGLGGWGNGNSETWCRQGTHPGSPPYGTKENPIDYGSGGGFAHTIRYGYHADGGAGGGVIKILAYNININTTSGSRISADGLPGYKMSSDLSSGGGSGGSIIIQTVSDFAEQFSTSVIGGKGNPSCADQAGGNGTLWVYSSDQASATPYSVSAVGGLQGGGESGNGGGGRIAIMKPNQYGIEKSIRKISPADGSSPYALRGGDVIEVSLHVTNLTVNLPVVITDEFFNDGNGVKLVAEKGVGSNWSPQCVESGSRDSVVCTLVPTGRTTNPDLHYRLRVP